MSSKLDREQKLLLFLSKKQGYMTSSELAEKLDTSRKTVYRTIKQVNEKFSEEDLILSEKGRGYKLDYEKYIRLQDNLISKQSNFSPTERREQIMEELLLCSPKAKNVSELYKDYYVGETVIFNDEQIIGEQLKKYNLELERKSRTLSIRGKESNVRKAITDRIQGFNIVNIDELRNNKYLNFNNYDVLYILDQLKLMEKRLDITIPYPYDVNIFSHLYILLSRLRRVDSKVISSRKKEGMIERTEEVDKDSILYQVASSTISNIEKYLNVELPENEIEFLYQYLSSSRIGSSSKITTFSNEVVEITQFYLDEMEVLLNTSFQSEAMFLDLANHIKPMVNRLIHDIKVKNSLLSEIKITYNRIYEKVIFVSEAVSDKYQLPAINDDENGFLTLYFARMIETNQLPIRTIIMCTTGVGTSELLKVKISKKFPELEIVDVLSSRSLKNIANKYPDVELILTTINLEENSLVESLLVSAIFTEDDQVRLQRKIKEIYNER